MYKEALHLHWPDLLGVLLLDVEVFAGARGQARDRPQPAPLIGETDRNGPSTPPPERPTTAAAPYALDRPGHPDPEPGTKWYGDFHVLKDVDLTVEPGREDRDLRAFGSGKSTLIRCSQRPGGIPEGRPDRGRHHGQERPEKTSMPSAARSAWSSSSSTCSRNLTVLENLTLAPIWVRKVPKKEAEEGGDVTSWSGSRSPNRWTSTRVSCPAVSNSAWR